MTMGTERIVLDTNIWIFGLRDQADKPACAGVLRCLDRLVIKIPRQVVLELYANLSESEIQDLFRLINRYSDRIEMGWDKVELPLIRKYQKLGCKLGDAAVSAHLETLGVETLVSENRDFLVELTGLPFRVIRAEDLLRELEVSTECG